MTGKGGAIADILDESAKKLAPALGNDFAGAYKNILHDASDGLKNNAERATEHETAITKTFTGIKPDENEPALHGKPGSESTPNTGHSTGSAPGGDPLGDLGHPHAESTPVGDRPSGGDPVDLVTGEMFLYLQDLSLPGVLPLRLERVHMSNYRKGRWFGHTWASSLDQRIEIDDDGIHYAAPDGVVLHYPVPTQPGQLVLPAAGPLRPLSWDRETDTILIEQPEDGLSLSFPPGPTPGICRPLAAVVDRNGNRITFVYDHEGVPTDLYHSGGYHVAVESVVTSRGTRITGLDLVDPRDGDRTRLVSFAYDALGRLTDTVDSTGLPTVLEYDGQDRVVKWTDRLGRFYEYTFDSSGRVVRTDGTGGFLAARFAYDVQERVTTLTDSLGNVTRHHWNERNQVEKVVDARGGETLTEHDAHGRLVSRTDQLGHAMRVHRDADGEPTSLRQADGGVVEVEFAGPSPRPTLVTGPDGAVWRYAYDQRGNLLAAFGPDGTVSGYEYGERGDVTAVIDSLGRITRYRNDRAGLPVAVVSPTGAESLLERDAFGRVVAITDPLGAVTRLGWTLEGRKAWLARPDGTREEWDYDAEGNVLEHRDTHQGATRYEYGPFDVVLARTDPSGTRHEFAYDTEARLTKVTDAQGHEWRYEYGPGGELLSETDFNGRTLTYRHDAAGNVIERVNGAGQRTLFVRDAFGRITERRTEDAVHRFTYDAAGRISSAQGPDTLVEYTRDAAGRVLTEIVNGRSTAYEYDAAGRVVTRTTPTGAVSRWTYDDLGLPAELAASGHTLVFQRDRIGRETGRSLDAGAAALSQGYDELGRTIAQAIWAASGPSAPHAAGSGAHGEAGHRLLQHRTYTYRADGTPLEIGEQSGGTRRFELDAVGRVTSVHAATWTETYVYDAMGNLAHTGVPGADEDAQGEREYAGTVIRRAGRTTYEHDGQGRLVRSTRRTLSGQRKQWSYTWDADDRLTAVTTPDETTWRYTYDALGRRIAKRRVGPDGRTLAEIWFTWDQEHLAEQAVVGADGRADVLTWDWEPATHRVAAQTRRSWASQAPQAAIDTAFHAIVTDLAGTPTELLSADGRIAWRAATSLWGTARAASADADSGVDCPLRFPGQYHDPETGLNYNLLRYYDPETGSYISPDPLGLAAAPNHHAYVVNPLTWIDPLGLMGCFFSKPVDDDVPHATHGTTTATAATPSDANYSKPTAWADPNSMPSIYRLDERAPGKVAQEGLTPWNTTGQHSLWEHVVRHPEGSPDNTSRASQWVSTGTGSMFNDMKILGMTDGKYLYKIDPTATGGQFADVNATFGQHIYHAQNEFTHEGTIPPEAITGYLEPNQVLPKLNQHLTDFNPDEHVEPGEWNPLTQN